jgi:coproporphyrinogen III oxidase-like Fe-S oxidoreductase
MLKDPPRGPKEVRYLRWYREHLHYDRLGVGYGANSLFAGDLGKPGKSWRNIDQTMGYYDSIDQGRLPSLEGFDFDASDLRLLYVIKGLEGTPYLNADAYRQEFGRDLAADFSDQWVALQEIGWLKIDNNGDYTVTGDGIFYMSMIQRSICDDRNDELRRRAREAKPRQLQVLSAI